MCVLRGRLVGDESVKRYFMNIVRMAVVEVGEVIWFEREYVF